MSNAEARIFKRKQTTGEVRMRVSFQVECNRFGPAFDPDCAAHEIFCAVVDFAADYIVMNSESHLRK